MTKQNQQDELLFNQKCNKRIFLRVYSNHRSKVHMSLPNQDKREQLSNCNLDRHQTFDDQFAVLGK